jgi:tRNA nucleotidyltransferase (CCA-adding enzyme)
MKEILQKLLDEYKPSGDFRDDVRDTYRSPIEDLLKSGIFDAKVHFRYGGSLVKGTANKDSCDVDLLCYVEATSSMSIKDIYDKTTEILQKNGFLAVAKNSAIKVYGHQGDQTWDKTVDVVPGKYINNASGDVNLWCKKDGKMLKTNPDVQIEKVKTSKSKDIIRLIKLFRDKNNFKFKSFFLEIFSIDVVEPYFGKEDDLMDQLVAFCHHGSEIGKTKIYDPANPSNDIMSIHESYEFDVIRRQISRLLEALLTDDDKTIQACFLGQSFDADSGYLNVAKRNCSFLIFDPLKAQGPTIAAQKSHEKNFSNPLSYFSGTLIEKDWKIMFFISQEIRSAEWMICNSGYEARKQGCLRGDKFVPGNDKDETDSPMNKMRFETTSYYGNHFVQAKIKTQYGTIEYSPVFVVKIR